jgi:hypothetical protein
MPKPKPKPKPRKWKVINKASRDQREELSDISSEVESFATTCEPMELNLYVLVDARTKARFCECHLKASTIIKLATVDVPLDPEDQAEYRANREVVEDHVAYEKMKEDAKEGRTFSNIVAEFTTDWDEERPIKIIGGQHRYHAIQRRSLQRWTSCTA